MLKPKLALLYAVCIMPQKDIWSTANPPTLVGVVKAMQWKIREIDLQKGPKVAWNDGTGVYSQFGGEFDIEEVKPGDEIEVWTPDCKAAKNVKTIRAAVIRVHK